MPVCIYCTKNKTAEKFSKEHVLPRAFCGQGDNWTLIDTVCSECNRLFSTFEAHWAHSAIESIMRNFSGPISRGRKPRKRRVQATENDHIYIVQKNEPIAFEAGFAFPNEFYLRPQIIQTGEGLVVLAEDKEDSKALESAISKLIRLQMIKLSKPIDSEENQMFQIVTLRIDSASKTCSISSEKDEVNPSDNWLRSYPEPPVVRGSDGIERHLTPRCALDDRMRLYFRAERWSEVTELISDLLQGKNASLTTSPHDQTLVLGIRIKLPIIYRAVLKTGLNMFAHLAGVPLARDVAFNDLRRILLDKDADHDVMERCKILDDAAVVQDRAEFPTPGNTDQHRLMLDIFRGKLRFRIRLYGHLGYESILAPATPDIQSGTTTARVVVDFNNNGIREVSNWL